MSRTLVQRLHNPRSRTCHCDPACWCRRTTIGRAVKWWFPARWFGIRHKSKPPVEYSGHFVQPF